MAYMAISLSSIVAYTIFYWVLRYMEASRVSAVNYFQTVIVIVLASAFLGEQPSEHLLLGGALVLLGVYHDGTEVGTYLEFVGSRKRS